MNTLTDAGTSRVAFRLRHWLLKSKSGEIHGSRGSELSLYVDGEPRIHVVS